jgi:hypothetical protein
MSKRLANHALVRLQRLAAAQRQLGPEAGASTVEVLSWAAMSVVAIVTIGGALQVLGVDVINYVRSQLGV